MCGICGIWNPFDAASGRTRIDRMLESIVHRGPDGAGRFEQPGINLGMRRLAIIDLSGGDQPIFNEDRSVAVVFNGEIYNFRELRAQLEQSGHRFTTRSDTEVLVHGYEQWGDDLLHRLAGMFTFALWDHNKRRLLIARDRFGKKPLYYSRLGRELVFGSEIKALLAAGVSADLDDNALQHYLSLRYVPAPQTLFRSIMQLPPGHKIVLGDNEFAVERWWRLSYEPKTTYSLTEAADAVEQLMRTAVQRRLVSDVPLGCFLSGGLDSSTVLSFMSELTDEPVRTFSIGFDEGWASDELPAARSTAQAFGARHHEMRLSPGEFLRSLPAAVWHRDEPLAEPSEIPLMALSRMAREHVTVVLSGEGGDELFGGYPKYRVDSLLARAGRMGRGVMGEHRLHSLAAWHRLPRRARMAVTALATADPAERWPAWFGADRQVRLSANGLRPLDSVLDSIDGNMGSLDRMLALDVETYLADNLLVRGDKMTMAASIESRMPLLDHDLAEFVARLPEQLKASPRQAKIVVREIAKRRLPASLLSRKKIGFAVPISPWFRDELGDALEHYTLGRDARPDPLVAPDRVRRALALHRAGRYDFGKELWSLLTLDVWARIYLDGADPASISLARGD
ncbi:asparagine synthase (glutamine-hydrolyzing) [Mycolicibacterium smegmatis]|uniref:asparagine synthase (glutamine-hydrolyzing) n=1 Tax=Mycolicibacterium smegmatis (strain MKD8) TaxID=1214915 RepID=A0A2U9PYG3_MYCSE|nr:asparagine synthase (glutamine-hydrolyzing) [Mycolicibacterium smegmatis]AWT56777.1 asparagine synthase (glutamine-hydrolyzing) [Mycolicibacterium smegmatis MKD8]